MGNFALDPRAGDSALAHALRSAQERYAGGDWSAAESLCRRALSFDPAHFGALSLLGVIAAQTRRLGEAAELLARAAAANPDDTATHNNYGNVLKELGRFEEALASYRRALRLSPSFPEAHANCGNALLALGRLEAALSSYDRAIALRPEFAEAHYNRANALHELGRPEEALASYDKSIALLPRLAEAHANRGNALHSLGSFHAAAESYGHALRLAPRLAEARVGLGNALIELGRLEEAHECLRLALATAPACIEAHVSLGNAQRRAGRLEEALESYRRALEIDPRRPWLRGIWLHTRMQLCHWSNLDTELAALEERILAGEAATPPFPVLALIDSAAMQRRAAEIWIAKHAPQMPAPESPHRRTGGGRIRLGYFSSDFYGHAVACLIAGLIEAHDRSRFEVIGFSFGPDREDDMRARLRAAFDRFLDVRTRSAREIARFARELEVDIAIDLNGLTQNERTGIFAQRAAPIQVSYLGYTGTMGASYMDYLIADGAIITAGTREHYAERIAFLPHTFQANDRKRPLPEAAPPRAQLGIPAGAFVFCCFNSLYKITPAVFDVWMRILRRVPNSVLWLLEDHPRAARNLRREAESRQVSGSRLIFAPRAAYAQHLARHRAADLFLDTLPYNAHSTASDALWAGLPLVTCPGESFPARVAASLLHAVGLAELVARSLEEYEALGVALATDPGRMAAVKERLAWNRLSAPLFDTARLTAHVEAAYEQMVDRHRRGLNPDDIHVR